MNLEIPVIDLKNRKILFELEQDSRQSLQKIAKNVGLSKEAVFHRIKNLEKEGIIKKYIAEIDVYALGYVFYPVLLKLQNTNSTIESEMLLFLRKSAQVAWLTNCEGYWDINFTALVKNIFELNSFFEKFLEKYSEYIFEKRICVTTEISYFKRGFWLNKQATGIVRTGEHKKIEIEKLDGIDFSLLRFLSENARMPLVEIAEKLDTTSKAISYKIKKLEKEKIIQGSRILVDFSKMNYNFYKVWFVLKNMNAQNWKRLMAYFNFHSNMLWATKMIGYYDLSIEMEVASVGEFKNILNTIKQKFSDLIKQHESILIFEEHTMTYLPSNL